jgi:ribosomal protein S18 acetylase RimI-like enzyme
VASNKFGKVRLAEAGVAQADGHDQASLEVDADTAAGAHGLYERLSFVGTKTEVRYALDA